MGGKPKVDFIYDFGSPNSYLVHRTVPEIERRTGASFAYVPCLLGGIFKATGNQPPMVAFAGIKGKREYEMLELARFVKKHSLAKFRNNPHFPVNTLLAMRGAAACEIAGDQAAYAAYIEACMCAMWEQGLKMDDPEVFARALDTAGLDGGKTLKTGQREDAKQRLKDNTAAAVDRGVFGSPTIFVGGEMFFGKERLEQVEREIVAQAKDG